MEMREIRLECLRLAIAWVQGHPGGEELLEVPPRTLDEVEKAATAFAKFMGVD